MFPTTCGRVTPDEKTMHPTLLDFLVIRHLLIEIVVLKKKNYRVSKSSIRNIATMSVHTPIPSPAMAFKRTLKNFVVWIFSKLKKDNGNVRFLAVTAAEIYVENISNLFSTLLGMQYHRIFVISVKRLIKCSVRALALFLSLSLSRSLPFLENSRSTSDRLTYCSQREFNLDTQITVMVQYFLFRYILELIKEESAYFILIESVRNHACWSSGLRCR